MPITLTGQHQSSSQSIDADPKASSNVQTHPLDLAKPILLDCDYQYERNEDSRLTVRWFRDKEAEPFYQWLPELNSRHFADWIRPLVDQNFVSDPLDPMKRYRSLLVRRLSMNLTGQYTCLVSSLAGQDHKQASLTVYQPPRSFTFEHRIFPPPTFIGPAPRFGYPMESSGEGNLRRGNQQPTQFKNLQPQPQPQPQAQANQFHQTGIIRPPNNAATLQVSSGASMGTTSGQVAQSGANNGSHIGAATKIVYTHDGRAIAKRPKRQLNATPNWMVDKKSVSVFPGQSQVSNMMGLQNGRSNSVRHSLQLHHFICQASQLTPRPVMVLTVKRDAESIAQYLHEASSVSVRPYQVNHLDYFESAGKGRALAAGNATSQNTSLLITLYDITVSATVALNVSLGSPMTASPLNESPLQATQWEPKLSQTWPQAAARPVDSLVATTGINTILHFHPNQRMSFECHLEITGTEFELRKRINIKPEGK